MNKLIKNFLYLVKEKSSRIAIVGDCMLDEFFMVDTTRISPEAPIPVLKSKSFEPEISIPGGAGNLFVQLRNFNVEVNLYGFLDGQCKKQYAEVNNECYYLPSPYMIPRKRRFFQGRFPLCRLDIESDKYGMNNEDLSLAISKVMSAVDESTFQPEVVVFSDYDKGVFSSNDNVWINKFKDDVITIVDPKHGPLDKWKGCDIFKPNKIEAKKLSGLSIWQEQCDYFQKQLGCVAVVITHGGDGVFGKVGNKYFNYCSKKKIFCENVCGAGDCFVAFLALAISHSIDIIDAIKIAYETASIYVQKKHNKPVHPYELLALDDPIKAKFVSREFLSNRDFNLTLTNGCFDWLHSGHLKLLHESSRMGKLVVALNSDESVSRLKGDSRPLVPLEERMKMVAALECVDYVVSFEEDTPYEIIKEIRPNVLVKGGDYKKEDVVGADLVEKLCIIPLEEGISTSNKIEDFKSKLS